MSKKIEQIHDMIDEIMKEINWSIYDTNHDTKWREYKDRHGEPLNIRIIEGTNLLTNGRDTFKPTDVLLAYFWYQYKANHGHTPNRETQTLEEYIQTYGPIPREYICLDGERKSKKLRADIEWARPIEEIIKRGEEG